MVPSSDPFSAACGGLPGALLRTDISWDDVKATIYNLSLSQAASQARTDEQLRNLAASQANLVASHANLTASQANLTATQAASQARTDEQLRRLTEAVKDLTDYRRSRSIDVELDLTDVVAEQVLARGLVVKAIMENQALCRKRKSGKGVEWDGYIFCRNSSTPSSMTVFVIEAKSRVTDNAVKMIGKRVNRTIEILSEVREWGSSTDRATRESSQAFQMQAARLLSAMGGCEDVLVRPCIGFFRGSKSQALEERALALGIITVRRAMSQACTIRFPCGVLAEK